MRVRVLLSIFLPGVMSCPAVHGKDHWREILGKPQGEVAPPMQGDVEWRTDLDAALGEARETGRPLLVTWRCLPCKQCAVFDKEVLEGGPMLSDMNFRHCALLRRDRTVHVFWTRVGDAPEHLLHSTIELDGDWSTWSLSEPTSLLHPEEPWEGADLAVEPSVRGQVTTRVHQLRDPAVLDDEGTTWLLYCIAGESGIALARLTI